MRIQFPLLFALSLLALHFPVVGRSADSPTGFASELPQATPQKQEQLAASLREMLSPFVEASLQEHCGEDCPSFRVDPQFKKTHSDAQMDDLGFSRTSQPDSAPELQSVSVSVLIQDKVSQKARESLRKILANRLVNEANVPVIVRMSTLDAFGPLMERRNLPEIAKVGLSEKIGLVKASVWPICLLILAGMGLVALILVLRHRKELQRSKFEAKRFANESVVASSQPIQEDETHKRTSLTAEILRTRSEDLQWLIEDAAKRTDVTDLRQITTLYTANQITQYVRLSREAFAALTSLDQGATRPNPDAAAKWLPAALDLAHWRRMEEQADRLARIKHLSTVRANRVFRELRSMGTKALFIAALPEDRWPTLLATLASEERVKLGLALADFSESTAADRATLSNHLAQELDRQNENDGLLERTDDALQNFALYLSEKDGQRLWQELSNRAQANHSPIKATPTSVDSLLAGLDATAAAEVCSRLDVGTLSVILTQVSGETRAKVFQSLPKTLQARLGAITSKNQAPGEAQEMKARGALLETYREFVSGGMIQ